VRSGVDHASNEFVGYITHVLECSVVCDGDSLGGYGVDNADSGVSIEEEGSTRGEYVWIGRAFGGLQWVDSFVTEGRKNKVCSMNIVQRGVV
jgi:hypothetical protein